MYGERMPIVTVELWPVDEEMKSRVIKRITQAFADEDIPKEAVHIVLHETPKENWGTGGEQHSERFKNMG